MTRQSRDQDHPVARRNTCNVEQAREKLCHDAPPSRQHIYRLFHRGDVEGFFLGSGRGLRLYVDSIDEFKQRQSGEGLLADR
jgi:hypothetical protein